MEKSAWVRITTSQVVSKVKCLLRGVIVTPNGESNKGLVTFYNGESTGDPAIMICRAGTGETKQVVFATPLLCDRGLYVVLGSHVDECLIEYEPLKS